jgi:hypothetical protein
MKVVTEKNIIAYAIGMSGVMLASIVARPDGLLGLVAYICGLCLFGFGSILKGSIQEEEKW